MGMTEEVVSEDVAEQHLVNDNLMLRLYRAYVMFLAMLHFLPPSFLHL